MDTRKVTLFATIAVIALVAVGIGYAYTATTSNSGNNASPEYITLTQDGVGAYKFADGTQNVYWDAKDYKDGSVIKTDFSLAGEVKTDVVTTYDLVQIGSPFTLVPEQTGADAYAGLKIDISAKNFIMPFGTSTIIIKATDNTNTQYYKLIANNQFDEISSAGAEIHGHSINLAIDGTAYKPVTITVFYGLPHDTVITVQHDKGVSPVGPSEKPINDAELMFRVNTNKSNGSDTVTSITFDKYSLDTVVGANATTITATVTGGTNTGVIWTVSPKDGVITYSGDNTNTLSITPAGKGQVVITAKTKVGSMTATCVVSVSNKIVVTFNANGGSSTMDAQTITTYGQPRTLTMNSFTKAGTTFVGWNTEANGTGTAYTNGQDVSSIIDANPTLTLYAQWAPIITFNANGGNGTMDAQVMSYGVATALNANKFTYEGKTFQGWATSDSGDKVYDDGADITTKTDVTLYAKWSA